MESILAYDSDSSSEGSDESPNKKQKVTESDDIKVCEGNNRKTEKLESSIKPAVQVRLLSSNLSESKQIANTSYLSEITQNDFSDRLIDDKHETHSRDFFRTSADKNAKSPALFNSANQKTMSSSNMTGPNVKPYVSKRQRERLAQEKSLSIMANQPSQETDLTLTNGSFKGADYHPDKNEFSNRKDTDQVYRPSKKLHLNLKGHTKGVNCVRWNVTESYHHLLLSASMDHTVCVWDTREGGACMQSLANHTEAVKDAKWSHCGSQVLSCGYDKSARLFDVETGQVIKVFPHKNYVTCVQFHPSHPALFLAGTFKSSILCWDKRTGSVSAQLP
ncbi:WD repeat-containing protein wdr-5.3-like [Stylophora pistillata]|uniref:WD repeat-containing protein wdr-5.3-like n=1 Tax=Stylophora pistillata TaxID=50429 RepID=UPI000C04302C|nr:WD repeat-containing protein wdr-5.3-like [Stylophora pistillata]